VTILSQINTKSQLKRLRVTMFAYTEKKYKAFYYDLMMLLFFKKLFSLCNLKVNNLDTQRALNVSIREILDSIIKNWLLIMKIKHFNTVLRRLVACIRSSLLLKIQW
jgi:hypothetical protein